MDFEALIQDFGYLAIVLGTFLEGESTLVLAGFLSHDAHLKFTGVILAAFIGTLGADQMYFHIGRRKGKAYIESKPRLKAKSRKIMRLLDRHHLFLILGFRFFYGFRIITPVVLGTTSVSSLRYLALNSVSVFAWASLFGSIGYFFGTGVDTLFEQFEIYREWIIGSVVLLTIMLWLHFHGAAPINKSNVPSTDGDSAPPQ